MPHRLDILMITALPVRMRIPTTTPATRMHTLTTDTPITIGDTTRIIRGPIIPRFFSTFAFIVHFAILIGSTGLMGSAEIEGSLFVGADRGARLSVWGLGLSLATPVLPGVRLLAPGQADLLCARADLLHDPVGLLCVPVALLAIPADSLVIPADSLVMAGGVASAGTAAGTVNTVLS